MTRLFLPFALCLVCLVPSLAQTPEQTKGTIAYVQGLQSKEGGFFASGPDGQGKKPAMPSLRSTSSAIRTLKYLKADLPNMEAVEKFVAACFDKNSGGFKDHPSAREAEFVPTAVGIMAVIDLGMNPEPFKESVAKYISEKAKGFEDVRIGAAVFESLKMKGPKNDEWLAEVKKNWNADGTSGKGDGQARATAGLAVTMLRFGSKAFDEKAVMKTLLDGQRLNGGYGKEDAPVSDLETCYRVSRAFHMMKQKPSDVENLRSFVLKCRNEDHGYGISPGEPSSIGSTYFATIIQYWMKD